MKTWSMKTWSILLILLLALALIGGIVACGEAQPDQDYRSEEAITVVKSYLSSLAEAPEAKDYVSDLFTNYGWDSTYLGENEWRVQIYHPETSGIRSYGAKWSVYGADMSRIYGGDGTEGMIKGLNRGPNYREQEAIAAVHAYYYSLAKGPEANYYVRNLIMEYNWGSTYMRENEWSVEAYKTESSGLHMGYASWMVYGPDMSRIDCHEWDASRIKGEIEELSKGY